MHEKERHRLILSAVEGKPVVTVQELVDMTEASEATIRRDIAALHLQKRLRRVRGAALLPATADVPAPPEREEHHRADGEEQADPAHERRVHRHARRGAGHGEAGSGDGDGDR